MAETLLPNAIRPFAPSVAGKHQCRALAESMYAPAEGLREISRQLSTSITQEFLQCCNSLGEGAADSVRRTRTFSVCVQHGRINADLCVPQMATWTLCWIALLWTAASLQLYPEIVRKTHTHLVLKTSRAPESIPQV